MKILFLFTGGTIGSTVIGDTIATDRKKPYLLLEAYASRFDIPFLYDTEEPYTALSENNTGETLTLLLASVARGLSGDYDGIVVTHGTDTLQYSAAALSYAFSDTRIPICLVSSNAPIEDPTANGLLNLHGAIRFITEVGTPGVWVPYQNRGEELRIHRGTRLLGSVAFSDRVASIHDGYYGTLGEGQPFKKNPDYRELTDGMAAMGAVTLPTYCRDILVVEPFPGRCYPTIKDGVRYIIHTSYHSGTINTASPATKEFFEEAKERGIIPFLTGVTSGAAYESTHLFRELGLHPLYNIAPISVFVKLWMWHTLHPEAPASEIILTPLGGDIVPE